MAGIEFCDEINSESVSSTTVIRGLLKNLLLQASQKWPGLPKGVKFDPSDQEIVEHLLAKVGMKGKPHPFIEEFITTVDKEDGICYTHPQNLPGQL